MSFFENWVQEDIKKIENRVMTFEVNCYKGRPSKYMMQSALNNNNVVFLQMAFDYLEIPKNLTLKERITYYHLLSEEETK